MAYTIQWIVNMLYVICISFFKRWGFFSFWAVGHNCVRNISVWTWWVWNTLHDHLEKCISFVSSINSTSGFSCPGYHHRSYLYSETLSSDMSPNQDMNSPVQGTHLSFHRCPMSAFPRPCRPSLPTSGGRERDTLHKVNLSENTQPGSDSLTLRFVESYEAQQTSRNVRAAAHRVAGSTNAAGLCPNGPSRRSGSQGARLQGAPGGQVSWPSEFRRVRRKAVPSPVSRRASGEEALGARMEALGHPGGFRRGAQVSHPSE